MPTILNESQYAVAESTFAVQVSFFDEIGDAVIPTDAKWSLVNEHGVTVNARVDVPITPIAAVVTIVMTGNDLLYSDGCYRTLFIKGTYNSSLGNGLAIADSLRFKVVPLSQKKC